MPDDDTSREFFEKTVSLMQENGYENYEISNFAKISSVPGTVPGTSPYKCKHNLNYWQGVDYVGIGAGAHGRLYLKNEEQRSATVNFHAPEKWLKEVASEGNAIQKIEKISKQELLEEGLKSQS